MPRSLSIVIPAFNEAARLGKTLDTVFTYLRENFSEGEVIVVDDGSKDATVAVAEESFARAGSIVTRLIKVEPNRGKGHAVRVGLLAAHAPIALFSDADLSTPIDETPKLFDAITRDGVDVAFGSRALDRSLIGVHQPWRREQGGRVFNLVVRLATRLPYWDTQCGFKAFNLERCRPIIEAARIDRFGFDVELLYVAHLAGLNLKEIAVRWNHDDGSKLNVISDSLKAIDEVRTISSWARKGLYAPAIEEVHRRLVQNSAQKSRNVDAFQDEAAPELAGVSSSGNANEN
jgi:glycosyltransferase involved in cell wall biosynthesis